MKVHVTVKERKEVDLDKETMIDVADAVIREVFDIPKQAYIREGILYKWWTSGGGSHSWEEREEKRRATNGDAQILEILQKIHEYRFKEDK